MHSLKSSSKIAYYVRKNNLTECFSTFEPVFTLRHYTPGELIISPFLESDCVQFVVEGNMLIYDMPTENSFFTVTSPYYQASILGEIELIDPTFKPSFVEAKTDVYTLTLSYEEYGDRMRKDPAFLTAVAVSLAKKLNNAVQSSNKVTARDQVLKYIDILAPGAEIEDITTLSQAFHVSTRQLIRALNGLVDEGYLSHPRKGTYEVLRRTIDG